MRQLYVLVISLFVIFALSCNSNTNVNNQQGDNSADTVNFAELMYIEDFYDFGSIKVGEVVSYTFRFRNQGNSPLIVKDVITGCGCTTAKLSKKIFEPNEIGQIEVTFNSTGWYGSQYKSVVLRTNSAISEKSVTIKANVI